DGHGGGDVERRIADHDDATVLERLLQPRRAARGADAQQLGAILVVAAEAPEREVGARPARSTLSRAPSRRLPVPRPIAMRRPSASSSRSAVTPGWTVKPVARASSSPRRPT